ncbi:hypothetical protein TNIN_500341 [Trichonephila inaurata madagascariensis]|uniref:Uncharacterized protein n=1 Tax=Trichonephila inaurata madagascariensis TaxID=2747483 RepID=A0A8X6XJR3_9ARAC|nr:hypothetical protein TNIN_500341 [Trichonephila inaurata madagascariensis]
MPPEDFRRSFPGVMFSNSVPFCGCSGSPHRRCGASHGGTPAFFLADWVPARQSQGAGGERYVPGFFPSWLKFFGTGQHLLRRAPAALPGPRAGPALRALLTLALTPPGKKGIVGTTVTLGESARQMAHLARCCGVDVNLTLIRPIGLRNCLPPPPPAPRTRKSGPQFRAGAAASPRPRLPSASCAGAVPGGGCAPGPRDDPGIGQRA